MAEYEKTERLRALHAKVHTDERGHAVWDDTIRTANFELVSTQRLRKMLDSKDRRHRDDARRLAEEPADGYLAQDAGSGHLRIIDDNDLQALLDADGKLAGRPRQPAAAPPAADTPADAQPQFDLVSTQALRKILDIPEKRDTTAREKPPRDEGGGFDPYNTG